MVNDFSKYEPEPDFEGGLMKVFHGLLSIQAEKSRQELIDEVKRTSRSELDYLNKMARLRNLGKI